MLPGAASVERLAGELATADFLLLTTRYDGWNEPNASMSYEADVASQVVAERFCKRSERGNYALLERCDRTPAR